MASLYIRDLDAKLVIAIKKKALDEQIPLKTFLVPFLELAANSKPVKK